MLNLNGLITKFIKTKYKANNEKEQTLIRFAFAVLISLYAGFFSHGDVVQFAGLHFSHAEIVSYTYLTGISVICLLLAITGFPKTVWRISMLVSDVTFLSLAMGIVPHNAVPLFFIYLWVIFGFGFRFGNTYLLAGMILSVAGFSLAFQFSEYWQSRQAFGIGVILMLIMLPSYVSFFIRRLNTTKINLEKAVMKADAANDAKSKFLANMSHELRTPLNGVITVSDLLSETNLTHEQQEYADTIQSSARTLLELINDVLDFSKIESEKIILDNICFDIHACINEVTKIIKPLAEKKDLSIHNNISKSAPRFIYGDPVRIKQILINLANNAVKFTERGNISIHTYSKGVTENKAHYCFEVIDTGIGISEEAQDRIFERFVQEDDTTTRQFGGTGLGISIAKQLVELMGGMIGVSSNPGKGSRFWFEIDVNVAQMQDFDSLEADTLIISSNDKLISKWKKLLQSWDNKIVVKGSVDDALDILHIWRHSKQKCTAILDEDALHMSPVRAAQLIKETGIRKITLMLSTMNPMQINNPGVQMYYDNILGLPIDSRQLYHAIRGENEPNEYNGVVSLSSHIEQKILNRVISLNVLVAEDQSTNQFVFRRILETQGHKISMVDDGQQALDILGVEKFDVAIVDLNMPNVNGIEVIKMYKYMEPDSRMPFVIITATTSQEVLNECTEVADAVLVKPIEKQQLLDVLQKIASNRSSISGHSEAEINSSRFNGIPIMNTSMLDDMLGMDCDEGFLSELFSIFERDAARIVIELETSLRDIKNLPTARSQAHALKGIANNVSAKRLAAVARYCEDEIQSNPDITRQADPLIDELNHSLKSTCSAMKEYLSIKSTQLADS